MSNKTITLLAMVTALVLTNAAMADMYVDFSVGELNLDYNATTKVMVITSTVSGTSNGSTLEAGVYDDPGDLSNLLDSIQIDQDDFAFTLYSLSVTFSQNGTNDWSASGSLSLLDGTGSQVLSADFNSSAVAMITGGRTFFLDGYLTPLTGSGNPGVLVPSVYSWTMSDGGSPAETITVNNATSFDNGTMLNTQFNTNVAITLDQFLTGNRSLDDGDSHMTVTPAPAGVLLGIIGLGMIGARMRKYA